MDTRKIKFTSYQNLANEICKEFQKRGFLAFWVGGSVRDLLLKRKNFDIDIATDAPPSEIKKVLKARGLKCYEAGEKFGTIGAATKEGNIEITTFRTESSYSDSRHPDKVSFTRDVKADAGRRDFTVNALYFNPADGEILDFFGGLKDLESKTLKFVGDPEKRIKEDALRLLRAVRLAADLNFKIGAKDLAAIKKNAARINKISAERIKNELDKIFSGANFIQGILLLDKTFLLEALFPEVDNSKRVVQSKDFHAEGNVFNHTVNAMRQTQKYSLSLRYAVFFHDIGKKFTSRKTVRAGRDHVSFHGHAGKSAEMFSAIAKRLRFPKKQGSEIHWLILHHMDLLDPKEFNEKTLVKWAKNEHFGDLIKLRAADSLGGTATDPLGKVIPKDISGLNRAYSLWKKLHAAARINLISGDEIMRRLKIKQGKRVGLILEEIKSRQILGEIKNKKEAIAYLDKFNKKNT